MGCGKQKIDTSDYFAWKEGKGEVVPIKLKQNGRAHKNVISFSKSPIPTTPPIINNLPKRTVKFLDPETTNIVRTEQKRIKSENWQKQLEWWALGRAQEEARKEDTKRENAAARRREHILMITDNNFDWYTRKGLCAFKTESCGIVNDRKCIICLKPIHAYTCPFSEDKAWSSTLFYTLEWEHEECYHPECFFFNQHNKGNCGFRFRDDLVCEDNRCRRLYYWWYKGGVGGGRQMRLCNVNHRRLPFDQMGIFIMAKYLMYLLNNKEEREKWQKKRVARKQRLIQRV